MGSWKSDWSRIGCNLTESVEDVADLLDGALGSKFHVSDRVWKKVSEGTKSKKKKINIILFLGKMFSLPLEQKHIPLLSHLGELHH